MLAPVDNQATVLAVLGDRYRLPLELLAPGRVVVAESPHPRLPARAFAREGGVVVAVAPRWAAVLREHLDGPATIRPALEAGILASLLGLAVHNLVDFNWQIPASAATPEEKSNAASAPSSSTKSASGTQAWGMPSSSSTDWYASRMNP